MTIREAIVEGNAVLETAGIENSGLDASLLLAEVLNVSRSSLIAAGSDPLAETSLAAFRCLLQRRLSGECIAYILGRKEFYGLEFMVNPSVLVPRPDTEILVEAALKELEKRVCCKTSILQEQPLKPAKLTGFCKRLMRHETGINRQPVRVVDLCTGSGAIAIALKHAMPELEVWAADISAEALAVARTNAARLLPKDSIHFCHSDLYSSLPIARCSLLISNPPYIPNAEIDGLSPEVRAEPVLALDGGRDGLDIIRNIIAHAPDFLCSGGALLLEADPRQMETITALLDQAGFTGIHIHKDLSGKERVITGKYDLLHEV